MPPNFKKLKWKSKSQFKAAYYYYKLTSTRKETMETLACTYTSCRYFTTHLVHWKLSLPNVPRLYRDITVPRLFNLSDFCAQICENQNNNENIKIGRAHV